MICCQWQLGKGVWKIKNCANSWWTDNPLSHHQGLWAVAAWWGEDEEWKISVKGVRGTCCSRCSIIVRTYHFLGDLHFLSLPSSILVPLHHSKSSTHLQVPVTTPSLSFLHYKTLNSSNSSWVPCSPHTLILSCTYCFQCPSTVTWTEGRRCYAV